ncbi:MAG: transcriptional regulator, LuxR family [Caulobacteraceae bacterium]|jgi:DNA-binding CsgD family transcriptional regulator|nr:transcriptional regulator, LuxR family [Caulobacteraceae bacterium]
MDRTAAALALISDLSTAPTVRRAVEIFQQAIEPFGIDLYRTAAMGNLVRGGVEAATVSNWSQEWESFYMGSRAFAFDPIAQQALKGGGQGFFWHDVDQAPTLAGRRFMRDAADTGMVDGFIAVRAGAPGELRCIVSLSGSQPLEWTDLERGVVSFIANSMMSRLLYLRDVQLSPKVRAMSEREKDILRRAALGRPDKRIAQELGCAHDTVRAHWRSIRTKLGASDRAHAVAVAIWSDQIAP